jgi:hypothetical protein
MARHDERKRVGAARLPHGARCRADRARDFRIGTRFAERDRGDRLPDAALEWRAERRERNVDAVRRIAEVLRDLACRALRDAVSALPSEQSPSTAKGVRSFAAYGIAVAVIGRIRFPASDAPPPETRPPLTTVIPASSAAAAT